MKLIKWLLWLVLFVGVVAVGGAIFLVNKVDPNDFKPQIAQQVKSTIGRDLSIDGDLSWRFYPWVGVTMNEFTLSNREGFAPENMLEAMQADVQVKLIPLFSKNFEIGKINLTSPRIYLSKNTEGEPNWGDLVQGNAKAAAQDIAPGEAAGAALGGLVIQGVDIESGLIDWNDEQVGQHYQLGELNLNTGTVKPGEPIDFELDTNLSGSELPETAKIVLSGDLWVSESFDDIKLSGVHGNLGMGEISADTNIEALRFTVPTGELGVDAIDAKFSMADLAADVKIKTLSFSVDSGQLQAVDIDGTVNQDQLEATAKANTLEFSVPDQQVTVDALTGKVAMDLINADVNAQSITYGLASGKAKAGTLTYSGQYESFPFEGTSEEVLFDVNANALEIAKQTLVSEFNTLPIKAESAQLKLDLDNETFSSPDFAVTIDKASFNGNVSIQHLLSDIQASGHVISNQFDPRALIETLGINVLEDLPANAVRSLTVDTDFDGGLTNISVDKMILKVDDSTLKGSFSMKNFAQPISRFDLQLDKLNADNYLSEEKKAVAEKTGPGAAVALPFAAFKGLDVKGKIGIGELNITDMLSNNVLVNIDTEKDRIQIAPISARVYGGETTNTLVYDISGDTPKVQIDSKLKSLNLGPFLQAMQMTDRIEGIGNVSSNITASGLSADEMIANLSGIINIDLNDGAIRGADIQKSMIEVAGLYKQLKGKDLGLSTDIGDKTKFSNLSSEIKIDQGVLRTDNIDLRAPGLRVTGGGKVDLNTEKLDLKLLVSVVETFEGQGGQAVEELKGETIPLKISGTLAAPKLLPDLSKIAQRQLERKLSEKYLGGKKVSGDAFKKKLKDKLNRKLAEKLGLPIPEEPEETTEAEQAKESAEEDVSPALIDLEADDADAEEDVDEINPMIDAESEAEPEPEPQDPEDLLKERLKQEKEKLKGKLLDKLFGS